MPQVLTTNALILCPHGGKGTSTPSNPKWPVNGGIVLLNGDVGKLSCPLCSGYKLQSMNLNATQVEGQNVMLATDFNHSHTWLPLVITEFHTTIDNSTPAPLPVGQPAPPLPPAMLDMVAPVVTAVPPILAFNSITMLPATLVVTFTLITLYPKQWLLALINKPLKYDKNMTNGLPPGLVVQPAGGKWDSSRLTIMLTMTAPFMASLTPGEHHFYMTGISQRGLSGYAEIILTVT